MVRWSAEEQELAIAIGAVARPDRVTHFGATPDFDVLDGDPSDLALED